MVREAIYTRHRNVPATTPRPDNFDAFFAETGVTVTASPPSQPSTPTTPSSTPSVASAVQALTKYIPAEVLGTYIALTGLLSGQPHALIFGLFAGFWFVTPFVVLSGYVAAERAGGLPVSMRLSAWPKWQMFASTVAFAPWAATIPGSVLHDFSWLTSQVGGVTAILVSFVLAIAGKLFVA